MEEDARIMNQNAIPCIRKWTKKWNMTLSGAFQRQILGVRVFQKIMPEQGLLSMKSTVRASVILSIRKR